MPLKRTVIACKENKNSLVTQHVLKTAKYCDK